MKKLLFSLFFLVSFFLVFHTALYAQSQTISPTPPGKLQTAYPLNTNPDVPQNFHTYTQNVFIEILSTATCFVGGTDIINPGQKCLGIDPQTKKIGYVQNSGGLAQVVGGMIGATYNIPISTSQYGADLAAHFGITRNSYAAIPSDPGGNSSKTGFGTGIGFVALTPVLQIWKTFRNLTYLLFVFIFVILGLGIMFRINIDARTVMTIQNQIPKIIIGLVLITLSYAIAGFLIDMMYVIIYLVIHIFASQGLASIGGISNNPLAAAGGLGGINGIAAPAAQGVGGMVASLFDGSIGGWIGGIVTAIIGGFLGSAIPIPILGNVIGAAAGFAAGMLFGSKILGLVAMAIAYLIISIAILNVLFRVWFMLIKAYVFIFLDVIFAPFWILGGIIPGAGGGFGPWIRSLTANLMAFPTVIVLFMIGRTMQEQANSLGGNFIPPLIGNPGAGSGEAVGALLGLGIILIMPEAVTITKSALKAPEMKYTAAVGKAIGTGQGFVSKPMGKAWQGLVGKNADGTYGVLRGAAIDKFNKSVVGNRWNKSKVGSFINDQRNANKRRRYEHQFGKAPTETDDKGKGKDNPKDDAAKQPPPTERAEGPELGGPQDPQTSGETASQKATREAAERAEAAAKVAAENSAASLKKQTDGSTDGTDTSGGTA